MSKVDKVEKVEKVDKVKSKRGKKIDTTVDPSIFEQVPPVIKPKVVLESQPDPEPPVPSIKVNTLCTVVAGIYKGNTGKVIRDVDLNRVIVLFDQGGKFVIAKENLVIR